MAKRNSLNGKHPTVTWNSSNGKYCLHMPNGKYGDTTSMEFDPPPFDPNLSLQEQLVAEYRKQTAFAHA